MSAADSPARDDAALSSADSPAKENATKKKRTRKAPAAPKAKKPGRRQYGEADDGSAIVSVTELLNNLGWKTPGLMRWSANFAAQACADAMAGGASYVDAVAHAKRAPFVKRDEAAEAGTMAHAMAEALVCGGDPEAALDVLAPLEVQDAARRAFERFATWWRDCGLSLHMSEEQIVDRAVGYGGTLDLVLRTAEGELVLADIKTGRGIYDDVAVQLAGYARLLRTVRGVPVKRAIVIHMPADGEPQIVDVSADVLVAGEVVFEACLSINKARRAVKLTKGVAS